MANPVPDDIFTAATQGDIEKVTTLLEADPGLVHAKDGFGLTPLRWVVLKGHLQVARLLITRGASVDAREEGNRTPLYWAVREGFVELAKLLIAEGADVHTLLGTEPGSSGTLLHVAADYGSTDVAALLIDKGVPVDSRTINGETPLHCAATQGHTEVAGLLVSKGADVNARDAARMTALHFAAAGGNEQLVRLLMACGANPKTRDVGGRSSLRMAANKEIADLLRGHRSRRWAAVSKGFGRLLNSLKKLLFRG